jgi:hypothetical protein
VRPAIENESCGLIHNTDKRIVGSILEIISVSGSLGEAIELSAGYCVRLAPRDAAGGGTDGRRPGRIVCAGRREDFNIAACGTFMDSLLLCGTYQIA